MKKQRRLIPAALGLALVLAVMLIPGRYAGPAYAATPSVFASVSEPIGVAATPGKLLVTRPFCGDPVSQRIVRRLLMGITALLILWIAGTQF